MVEASARVTVVDANWICYKEAMYQALNADRIMTATEPHRHGMQFPWAALAVARLVEPGSVVLHDHTRLPGRFFGRMTASIQADLTT